MTEIKNITAGNPADARLPNEPFTVWGRLIPALDKGKWTYETETFPTASEMRFPDEPYDPAEDDAVFLGAYDGERCVGLAVLREDMFRYLYLDDLKVCRDFRGKGVGGLLIEACMEQARAEGKQGVWTVGQDDNLSACLFYLSHGFEIGGFDNRGYRGTSQEGKADVYFYRDCGADDPAGGNA